MLLGWLLEARRKRGPCWMVDMQTQGKNERQKEWACRDGCISEARGHIRGHTIYQGHWECAGEKGMPASLRRSVMALPWSQGWQQNLPYNLAHWWQWGCLFPLLGWIVAVCMCVYVCNIYIYLFINIKLIIKLILNIIYILKIHTHTLIPRVCEYYFIWTKESLPIWISQGSLDEEIVMGYQDGP